MDLLKIFGTNLKNYRLEKKLSQAELANLCEMHRNYISDIECFKRSISINNIQRIANALKIPAYKLFIETK